MNDANENVMNASLSKGFINRPQMNECGIFRWTLFLSRDEVSSNNLNIPKSLSMNELYVGMDTLRMLRCST